MIFYYEFSKNINEKNKYLTNVNIHRLVILHRFFLVIVLFGQIGTNLVRIYNLHFCGARQFWRKSLVFDEDIFPTSENKCFKISLGHDKIFPSFWRFFSKSEISITVILTKIQNVGKQF